MRRQADTEGRFHYLIHDKYGDPSAPRAIALAILALATGNAIAAHVVGVLNFRALFPATLSWESDMGWKILIPVAIVVLLGIAWWRRGENKYSVRRNSMD